MKKILTLIGGALLAMQSLTATAENRKWDFRNWSPATVANLKAGADWSDIEKATDIDKGPNRPFKGQLLLGGYRFRYGRRNNAYSQWRSYCRTERTTLY